MGEAPLAGLSVFLITLNEADRLGTTLAAVKGLASEIIVVDSGSTDGTVEVARTAGARVIREAWRGYGPQKRFAEEQCAGPWLLNLDADEFVPPELAAEIRALFAAGEPRHVAYKVQIADQLPDSPAPKRFAYGPSPVRLYRKDAGRYSDSPVHDRVDLKPGSSVGRLRQRIHHRSSRSLAHQLAKINSYTDKQVADLAARGKTLSAWRLLFEMPAAFFKYYVLRRQFIHGFYGFTTSITAAFGRYLRVAKLIEWQRDEARRRPDKR
jgi:glycosyltransferase involved in cell wall biosynthesis